MFIQELGNFIDLKDKSQILLLLSVFPIISLLVTSYLKFFNYNGLKPLPAHKAKNKQRKLGHWIPEDYKFPTPPPFPNFDLDKTEPIAYRAFKHKFNITMGIKNLNPHEWLEIDNEWHNFHDLKVKRIEDKGEKNYKTLPQAMPAALELLDELREYLPNRYPSMFKKTKFGIANIVTKENFDYKSPEWDKDPMYVVSLLTHDDFAVLTEEEDGQYRFTSGAIQLAGSWRFRDKFNTTLSEIHYNANVPKYESHLKKSMEKYFFNMTPESLVVRYNYSFQMDSNLDWASSTLGDEEDHVYRFTGDSKAESIDGIMYRSERQTLRRLPKTGAVVFTIHTYFLPLVKICEEPFVPRRLLDSVENWDEESKKYKGLIKWKDIVLPYLKEKAEEQAKQGYVVEKEVLNYPF